MAVQAAGPVPVVPAGGEVEKPQGHGGLVLACVQGGQREAQIRLKVGLDRQAVALIAHKLGSPP